MAEPLGTLEVKVRGDTAPLEKNLGEAKAMAEKTAALYDLVLFPILAWPARVMTMIRGG